MWQPPNCITVQPQDRLTAQPYEPPNRKNRKMIFVIADDITGAAEIAGMAHRYGLHTTLTTSVPSSIEEGADVVVFATDARSVSPAEAYAMTAEVAQAVTAWLCTGDEKGKIIFRKTDSALRGNVREELQAIIDHSRYSEALYLPANPSKGRVIRDGIYYIGDKPIAETDFRFDPEFPATTSSVAERFPGLPFADAVTKADIDRFRQIWRDGSVADYFVYGWGVPESEDGILSWISGGFRRFGGDAFAGGKSYPGVRVPKIRVRQKTQ